MRIKGWLESYGLQLTMYRATSANQMTLPIEIEITIKKAIKYFRVRLGSKLTYSKQADKITTQLSRLMANVVVSLPSRRNLFMEAENNILLYIHN